MNIEIRDDSVFISGYVNACERYSKPIKESLHGKVTTFLERVKAGVFGKAIKRNDDILVLLNHDNQRQLARTSDGTAKLIEDAIGLRAEVTVKDADVIEKAKNNQLVGWSFGFYANDDVQGVENGVNTRTITDLDLVEVSILDDTRSPAYYGTSIESRSEDNRVFETRDMLFDEINKQAQEEKENVWKESDAKIDEINRNAEDKKVDLLADKIVEKLLIKLKEQKENQDVRSIKEEQKIDYSKFEERLKKI